MAVANEQEHIHLIWSATDHRVIIEDQYRQRFLAVVQEAIESCKVHRRADRAAFRKQFKALLDFLGQWAFERKEKLARIFLTVGQERLLFLVVTKARNYDNDLESELTQLDVEVAHNQDFSRICLSVQALPCCGKNGYGSFCNPRATLEYAWLNVE